MPRYNPQQNTVHAANDAEGAVHLAMHNAEKAVYSSRVANHFFSRANFAGCSGIFLAVTGVIGEAGGALLFANNVIREPNHATLAGLAGIALGILSLVISYRLTRKGLKSSRGGSQYLDLSEVYDARAADHFNTAADVYPRIEK